MSGVDVEKLKAMLISPESFTAQGRRDMAASVEAAYGPKPPAPPDAGRLSDKPCKKCGKYMVYVTEIGDNPDYNITCKGCGHSYEVDGADA